MKKFISFLLSLVCLLGVFAGCGDNTSDTTGNSSGSDTSVDYTIDEKTTDIRLIAKSALPKYESDERRQFAISGLIQAYFYQLMDLVEEYYDYLDVKEIEREI